MKQMLTHMPWLVEIGVGEYLLDVTHINSECSLHMGGKCVISFDHTLIHSNS